MYKTLFFMKRRPDLSVEEFRAYYEAHHRRIGEQVLTRARRYMRRYVEPLAEGQSEVDFDVITEIWFADQAEYERQMTEIEASGALVTILADEENLFDRSRHRMMTVDEVVSAIGDAVA